MLIRYGQAVILAAVAALMGNAAWTQETWPQGGFATGYAPPAVSVPAKSCQSKGCCATGACCKDGKCCKDGEPCCTNKGCISALTPAGCCTTGACCKDGKCCKGKKCEQATFGVNERNFDVIGITLAIKGGDCCCKDKKCDANCTCCKGSKCECSKGGECCCKDGKCSCKDKSGCCCNAKTSGDCCCKGKTSVAKMGCGCPFVNKLAKSTAIIMVMPSSLPLLGTCHPAAMGMMPHPPMPMGPQVMLPMPLPPPMPGLPPMPGMTPPIMPPQTIGMPVPPSPGYCPSQMATPILPCPPTLLESVPVKEHLCVDTCLLQLLDLANEVCSLMHPRGPSLCASALEFAMMGMCPTMDRCGGAYCGECTTPAPYVVHPPQYIVPAPPFPLPSELNKQEAAWACPNCCGMGGKVVAKGQPVVYSCAVTTPTSAAKVRINAVPSSTELEMNVGDDTCVRCKKMTVKIGENEITVSRFEDRVRVRGDELKATADSVRSDRKDRIILEGDVVLHYKKDGHSANVTGDRIELNLSSGAVTIKPAEKTLTRPAVRINYFDAVVPNQ